MTNIKVEEANPSTILKEFDMLTIKSRSKTHPTRQSKCISQSVRLKNMIEEAKKNQTPGGVLEIAFPRSDDDMIAAAVDFLNHGSYTCPVWGPENHETTGIPFYKYPPMMFHHWIHEISVSSYMNIPSLEKWTEDRFLEEMGSVLTWDDISFCVCTDLIWGLPGSCSVLRNHCVVGAHQHLCELLESAHFKELMRREWWGEFSFRLLLAVASTKVEPPVQKHWWQFVNVKKEELNF